MNRRGDLSRSGCGQISLAINNLIDNAIKYSRMAWWKSLSKHGSLIHGSIKDHGGHPH